MLGHPLRRRHGLAGWPFAGRCCRRRRRGVPAAASGWRSLPGYTQTQAQAHPRARVTGQGGSGRGQAAEFRTRGPGWALDEEADEADMYSVIAILWRCGPGDCTSHYPDAPSRKKIVITMRARARPDPGDSTSRQVLSGPGVCAHGVARLPIGRRRLGPLLRFSAVGVLLRDDRAPAQAVSRMPPSLPSPPPPIPP